jgi:hypothetical protein
VGLSKACETVKLQTMAILPIFATLEPLEKVSHYTPLGIRFWDLAGYSAVVDGLEVTARPLLRRGPLRHAFQTLSGVYAFHALPGMRSLEVSDPNLPAGERLLETSPPTASRFVIEVRDRLGRFLTHTFQVDVPFRGIYPTQIPVSPPEDALPGFILFSQPSRMTLSDMAVVRAQIVERVGGSQLQPASFAVLEVQVSAGPVWPGIADKNGSVVVHFPYPPFDAPLSQLSPPVIPPESRAQSWDLTVQVRYRADAQVKADTFATLPDLGAILTQPQAQIWSTQAGPAQSTLSVRLEFGQPLMLKTAGRTEFWVES